MIKNFQDKEFNSIAEAVVAYLDGTDWDRGSIETVEETVGNTGVCLANLVELLVEKGLLTEEDVKDKVLRGLSA